MLVLLGLTAAIAWTPEAVRPPNVVLIVADDLGWGDVGFQGRTEWQTPELDRLAGRGTVLRRFYASAPVCGPSRAALLSGRSPIRSGVRRNRDDLPAEAVTLAEALAPRGYATALYGKWHRGEPRDGAAEAVHPMDLCSGGPNGARPTAFVPGDGPLAEVVTFRRMASVPLVPSLAGTSGIPMR